METESILVVLGVVAAIVLSVIGLVRKGVPVTPTAVGEQFGPMTIALKEAQGWVYDAEQLWLTGEITKNERFAEALGNLQQMLPDIDEATLVAAVKAAVGIAKGIIARSTGISDDEVRRGVFPGLTVEKTVADTDGEFHARIFVKD